MKISEQWLREWVNPPVDSAQLAHQLTMAGLEVDDSAPVVGPFSGVVVGEVLAVAGHPDADRLRVTRVDIGQGEPLQIVCGAPNVVAGMKVPVATVGAVLPGGLAIKTGKLRGVESQGMLCAASEIGLVDDVDGLMVLPADAPVGQDIREFLHLDDHVIDIGITPNRGDCLSVRGLARELAVINGLAVQPQTQAAVTGRFVADQAIELRSAGCPRYLGRVIRNLDAQAPTPAWLVQRLQRSGVRAHSLLVDVTNHVMLELGQPLHAFDLERIHGPVVVRASAGETLTLLNGQTVTLDHDTLVIADDQGVLALAGIMGGANSSVTESTTAILLESAFFDPLAIAGRARRYGLHTDASQRFERGVDHELAAQAIERATALILQLAGGEASDVIVREQREHLPVRPPIAASLAQLQARLGFAVQANFVVDTLNRLGMAVQGDASAWQVTPPSWRFDVAIAEDLAEEIGRIYGYDRIPARMPAWTLSLPAHQDHQPLSAWQQTLVTLGYQEAITFGFSDATLERALDPAGDLLTLANPISSELAVMRRTLLSSLIPAVQHNRNRQQERVWLFETGLRFVPQGNDITALQQIPTLALIATGPKAPEQWGQPTAALDFYDVKGHIEALLTQARIKAPQWVIAKQPWLHPGQSAAIEVAGVQLGYFGRLHPRLEQALALGRCWVAELSQDALMLPHVSNFTHLSRFPQVRRDIAILIDASMALDQVMATIRAAAGPLLIDVWLFDVYTGQGVGAGQRSLAFGLIWQHAERTLEEAEIKDGMDRIVSALAHNHQAQLRAS